MNRRRFLQTSTATGGSLLFGHASIATEAIKRRPIPSSGEAIPVIGLGTWQTFDVGSNTAARTRLKQVLSTLVEGGGSVVDSSPMYGSSESVVGDLASELDIGSKLFMATKVWTDGKKDGIRQMERSMQRMQAPVMDLMQVHNLVDAETHLDTLADWKEQGRIRYLGITHYHSGGYAAMKRLMNRYALDFIQINYSMSSPEAEREVLPLAMERGIATLINRPYEGGSLFRRTSGRELPGWASEFDCQSWGQFFLKFVLANPAVTCVIPGTSKVDHLRDNLAAGRGRTPNDAQLKKMSQYLSSL